MLIGELSKNSGLSRDTIRWYEKIGLFSGEKKSRNFSNYRNYDHDDLEKLLFIKQCKSFGFTLKEIREMLQLVAYENLNCQTVSPIIDAKLDVIEEKIIFLNRIQKKLVDLQEQCSGDCQAQILSDASDN